MLQVPLDKAVKKEQGETIRAAVGEIADPKQFKHGEIRDGQCGGCHEVHGGKRAFLLAKPYLAGGLPEFSPGAIMRCAWLS